MSALAPARALTLTLALLLPVALAGCFWGAKVDEDVTPAETNDSIVLDDRVIGLAQAKPVTYILPDQLRLPSVRTFFNGSVGAETGLGYENPGDRGGTSYNTQIIPFDVSDLIPPGQAAMLDLQLTWKNRPGEAARMNIFVDVPGLRTHESRSYYDEWSWTLPVETRVVSTVGVAGETHVVGVQVSNGRVLTGGQLEYSLRVNVHYAKDVLTPGIPYGIMVPANATGLFFESVKFAGDTHLDANFILIGPDGDRVAFHHFNDLNVPTESLYVPVTTPGEHVFYATSMKNGFLSVKADAPPEERALRRLSAEWQELVLVTDPVAPGTGEHHVYGTSTGYVEGVSVSFNLDTAFPLEVRPFIGGSQTLTGDVDIRVSSPDGPVARYHRALRYDDERGRIGFTDDQHTRENWFSAENLVRGQYTLSAAVMGTNGEIGVRVLTLKR